MEQASNSRPAEYGLGDDCAREKNSELQTDHRDRGYDGIRKGMQPEHPQPLCSLRERDEGIIAIHCVNHRAAGEPRDKTKLEGGKRNCWQHEMLGNIENVV